MAKTQVNNRIAQKQIGIIKMAQHQLGMDDESYRQLLAAEFAGAKSCTDLTAEQANRLIDIFQAKGFILKPRKQGWRNAAPHPGEKRTTKSGRNVVALASAAEKSKLNAVAALIKWRNEDGLERFLEKRIRIKGGKVRTSRDAYLAIEALKKMFENGMKGIYGAEWWTKEYPDARIMDYIARHCPEEYR